MSEILKCTDCSHITKFYKLCAEIKNEIRDRESAKTNMGLQVGLKILKCLTQVQEEYILPQILYPLQERDCRFKQTELETSF